jgi:hypothetical protein
MQNKLKMILIVMSIINLKFLTTYLNSFNYEIKLVMKIDKIYMNYLVKINFDMYFGLSQNPFTNWTVSPEPNKVA